jgi:hypothetical protein
LVFLE